MTTIEKEIRDCFPGKNNAGLRTTLRACRTAEEVMDLAEKIAFTNKGIAALFAIAALLPHE